MKFVLIFLFIFSTLASASMSSEAELGYIQAGGNSQLQTSNAKSVNSYSLDLNKFNFGGHYTYGESATTVSARNWDVNGKYERELNSHLSLVAGEVMEGNKFTGIKTRYNSDLGAKYFYLKLDTKNFFTELAYRYTIEDRYLPEENTYDNKARLYNEFSHKYSETVQYKLWLEYVPNFTESKDYLINGEASVTSIMTSMFSLKVAYLGMYDNLPAVEGLKNFDYTITTSLVAKF